jgi:hypothetical protein
MLLNVEMCDVVIAAGVHPRGPNTRRPTSSVDHDTYRLAKLREENLEVIRRVPFPLKNSSVGCRSAARHTEATPGLAFVALPGTKTQREGAEYVDYRV